MNYEFATEVGIDILAPIVIAFVVLYAFLPWNQSRLGWAMMTHGVGSAILFTSAVLTQHGLIPEEYPGSGIVILGIILLWIFGWIMLTWALAVPAWRRFRAWVSARRARV